ncbi:Hamartin protein-domain-containing protein [Xylariaceae sp. FL0662B]|nr:Hamartin protein-domain-containing protein [Xylariaceae sp. FL0662B]
MSSAPYVDPKVPPYSLFMQKKRPTSKELVKAINSFIPTAAFPLPDDLIEIIDRFLCKYEDKSDEAVADKLYDELLAIFHKDVTQEPARYPAFLAILRRLRPLVGQPPKVFQWFDLLMPLLDSLNQEKGLASEVEGSVLDLLTADDDNASSSSVGDTALQLAERIVLLWLDEFDVMKKVPDASAAFKEKHLRHIIILYGKKKPKDLLSILDKYVVKKAYRAQALSLFNTFVQSQPPHLYLILQTPLFGSLINCLQQDASTTIVSLALTALTMILPHMPSSLVPHLPTLFNIYARLLFWERELSSQLAVDPAKEHRQSPNASAWEKHAYAPDYDGTTIPHLVDYFTILYGLYPINFMDYIRKPQRYLRHAEVPNADDIEVQPTEIRHASERFRQCHLLHENFYTLTIDSEKTDFGRWIKSEPAEVVADCVALCQSSDALSIHDSPEAIHIDASGGDECDKEVHDSALLSSSSPIGTSGLSGAQEDTRRDTGSSFADSVASGRVQPTVMRHSSQSSYKSIRDSSSTRFSGTGGESPTLHRQIVQWGSQTQLQDMINSNKAIKSGLHQSMANDSVPSLALSTHESISDRPIAQAQPSVQAANPLSASTETTDAQIAHLNRQILMLYNDLTFERFMKQQHLTHMGELRRRHVREAASEAETQNLIIGNRHLKQRLEEAKKSETQAKKESEKSRTLAKKWEADLTTKLRALREEQKRWNVEGDALRAELETTKREADKLRTLVCEAEVRELGWKQNMQSVEINVSELERLRKEVERLTENERNFQAKEADRQAAMTRAAEADSRAEVLHTQLKACCSDFRQTHDAYQSQIAMLNEKLRDALKNDTGHNAESIKSQMESSLAASRAQQTALRDRIAELTRKNTALQETVLELQSTISSGLKAEHQPPLDPDIDLSSDSGSPLSYKNRQQRGFSDTEAFEATSYNPTPPLEPYNTVRTSGSQTRRPLSPLGTDASSTGRSSPTTVERYFGRGGVQNLRKDKKEKKDDKERKKSTGLRGIRGFV